MKTYSKILFGILLFVQVYSAQDSLRPEANFVKVMPRKFFNCSANGGLILNKSYSHLEVPSGGRGHYFDETTTQIGSDILPGFWFGLNTLFGKGQRQLVIGLSVSHTQYQYKDITNSTEPSLSSRFQNVFIRREWNVDVYGRLLALNFEIGMKRQLFYPFSIQHLFVVQSAIQRTERVKGNMNDYWSDNSYYYTVPFYSETTPINEKKTNINGKHSQNNIACYRLAFFVELNSKKTKLDIMLFRNFALSRRTRMPWWGVGVNYHFGKPDHKKKQKHNNREVKVYY